MEFRTIKEGTQYVDFLKINDDNFSDFISEMENIWDVLEENYLVKPEIIPNIVFRPLFGVKDDSRLYRDWIYNFNCLETFVNQLISKGFLKNDIVTPDFQQYEHIFIDVPETIYFNKQYLDTINKDWLKVGEIITNLNASLIFYGFQKG